MKTQANLYIVRVLAQRVIGFLLFFFFARWVPGVRSMVYFSLYFVFAIISLAMVRSVSPSTLAARGKIGKAECAGFAQTLQVGRCAASIRMI